MRVLVVGGSGLLGAEVCRQGLRAGHTIVGTYRSTGITVPGVTAHRLEVTDREAVRRLVDRVRPDAVVSTPYRYDDWRVTAEGAGHVALACARVGARLVHLSSDALHAGRPEPYPDDEPPTPIFPYGAAKAAAETAVRTVDPRAVLVRTSLILADSDGAQLRLCRAALAGEVHLFTDEVRCPVEVGDLAGAVLELTGTDHAGPLNVAGSQAVSRAELGRLVARRHGLDPAGLATTTSVAAGLHRPTEVRLDTARAAGELRTRLRGVEEFLAR